MHTASRNAPHVHARELALLGRVPLAGQQHGVAVAGVRHEACAARTASERSPYWCGSGSLGPARRRSGRRTRRVGGGAKHVGSLAVRRVRRARSQHGGGALQPARKPYPSAAARRHRWAGPPDRPAAATAAGAARTAASDSMPRRDTSSPACALATTRLDTWAVALAAARPRSSAVSEGLAATIAGVISEAMALGRAREFPLGAQRRVFRSGYRPVQWQWASPRSLRHAGHSGPDASWLRAAYAPLACSTCVSRFRGRRPPVSRHGGPWGAARRRARRGLCGVAAAAKLHRRPGARRHRVHHALRHRAVAPGAGARGAPLPHTHAARGSRSRKNSSSSAAARVVAPFRLGRLTRRSQRRVSWAASPPRAARPRSARGCVRRWPAAAVARRSARPR